MAQGPLHPCDCAKNGKESLEPKLWIDRFKDFEKFGTLRPTLPIVAAALAHTRVYTCARMHSHIHTQKQAPSTHTFAHNEYTHVRIHSRMHTHKTHLLMQMNTHSHEYEVRFSLF